MNPRGYGGRAKGFFLSGATFSWKVFRSHLGLIHLCLFTCYRCTRAHFHYYYLHINTQPIHYTCVYTCIVYILIGPYLHLVCIQHIILNWTGWKCYKSSWNNIKLHTCKIYNTHIQYIHTHILPHTNLYNHRHACTSVSIDMHTQHLQCVFLWNRTCKVLHTLCIYLFYAYHMHILYEYKCT